MVCSICGSNRHNKKTCDGKISISYNRNLVHGWSGDVDKYIRPDLRIVARCINVRVRRLNFSVHWTGIENRLRDPIERMSSKQIVQFIRRNEQFIQWPRTIRDIAYVCGYNTRHNRYVNIQSNEWENLPHNTDSIHLILEFCDTNQ